MLRDNLPILLKLDVLIAPSGLESVAVFNTEAQRGVEVEEGLIWLEFSAENMV